jgi:hypothetical protein
MAKSKPKPRKKRVKAGFLPGMGPVVIQQIEDLAENFQDIKLARVKLSNDEAEAQESLNVAMIENNMTTYKTLNGLVCVVNTVTKTVVKKEKKTGETETEEEGNED